MTKSFFREPAEGASWQGIVILSLVSFSVEIGRQRR